MSYATTLCGNCGQLRRDHDSGAWACECQGVFEDTLEESGALLDCLASGLEEDASVTACFGSAAYTSLAEQLYRAAREGQRAREG